MAFKEIFGKPTLEDIGNKRNNEKEAIALRSLLEASPLLQYLEVTQISSMAYTYTRRNLERVAQIRPINSDYKSKFTEKVEDITTRMSIIGDAVEYDRALGGDDLTWVDHQVEAMVPSIQARYIDLVINGSASNSGEFDGLVKQTPVMGLDLTLTNDNNLSFRRNIAKIAQAVEDIQLLGLKPLIIANTDAINAINIGGGVVGYLDKTADAFGKRQITTLNSAPLINCGRVNRAKNSTTGTGRDTHEVETVGIIPTKAEKTDIYIVGTGQNGVTMLTYGVSSTVSPLKFIDPKESTGAVRKIELELVAGLVVRDSRAVIRFGDVQL